MPTNEKCTNSHAPQHQLKWHSAFRQNPIFLKDQNMKNINTLLCLLLAKAAVVFLVDKCCSFVSFSCCQRLLFCPFLLLTNFALLSLSLVDKCCSFVSFSCCQMLLFCLFLLLSKVALLSLSLVDRCCSFVSFSCCQMLLFCLFLLLTDVALLSLSLVDKCCSFVSFSC